MLSVTCDEYEASTPYHAFRVLLRDLLGVRPGADQEAVHERLRARVLHNAPALLDWLPLLGIPLALAIPDTDKTGSLSDEFRKRRLEEVVADFLHVLLPTPSVLLVDDAHFLDGASADLLHQVAARLPSEPWLVVTARREMPGGWGGPPPSVTTLRLEPLGLDESIRLLQAAAWERPLPRPTMAALAARAGGNPLFLQSLVEVTDPAGAVLDLPESVQDLVTSQVDRLPPSDRAVLRYASVLGMSFDPADLSALVTGGVPAPGPETYERLAEFLVAEEAPLMRFRHALMREVAYQGLSYRSRQRLHDHAAQRLESADGDGRPELLSLHYFHAHRFDKAWSFSCLAAERARTKFANQEAVDLMTRAVEAERRGPRGMVAPSDLGALLEELGDTWFVIGLPEQAAEAYRRARRHFQSEPVRAARVVAKEARVDQRLRRLPQSLRRVSRALHTLETEPGRWATSARSLLAMRYAISRLGQGRVEEALRWGHRAARDAEEAVDKATLAQAYATLHGVYVAAGREPAISYGELALRAYTELDDLPHQADCTNNLAVSALDHNRWREAVETFAKAALIYRQIGDTQGEGLATYNQAEVLVRQGRLDQAVPLLEETLVTARSVSDDELVALVLRELGRVAGRRGELAAGLALLDQAKETFTEIDEPEEVSASELAACELLTLNGEAARSIERLAALPDDDESLSATLHRVRGAALLAVGETARAVEELEAAVSSATQRDNVYEHALSRIALAQAVGPLHEGAAASLVEARADLDELGVLNPLLPHPREGDDQGNRTLASSTKSR